MLRLNRGAPLITNCVTAPHFYQGPLYPWALHLRTLTCHVAPLTGVRVGPFAWPPATRQRHLRPARATRARPRGLSAASRLEVVPRAMSAPAAPASPRQHLQVKTSLFAIFLIKILNKNQKKRYKLQKFII